LVGLDLLVLYPHRCRLKVRIHGRPRSDRKRRFLLSAVAFSTSTRHPREAKPIHWAQRGGLACRPGNCVLTPRPHFTAPSCTLGNREVCASDGAAFRQERRPTRVCPTTQLNFDRRIRRALCSPHRRVWQPPERWSSFPASSSSMHTETPGAFLALVLRSGHVPAWCGLGQQKRMWPAVQATMSADQRDRLVRMLNNKGRDHGRSGRAIVRVEGCGDGPPENP
jgi:hypothetical protein